MDYAYQLNEKAADNAFGRQKEFYNLQNKTNLENASNSALIQRSSLEKAGVNPAMMQGNVSSNVATAPNTAPQGGTAPGTDQSMANGINALSQMANGMIQAENINQLKSLRETQGANLEQDTLKKFQETLLTQDIKDKLLPVQTEKEKETAENLRNNSKLLQQEVEKLVSDTVYQDILNEYVGAEKELALQFTAASIIAQYKSAALNEAQATQALSSAAHSMATIRAIDSQIQLNHAQSAQAYAAAEKFKADKDATAFENSMKQIIGVDRYAKFTKLTQSYLIKQGFSGAELTSQEAENYVLKLWLNALSGTAASATGAAMRK